MLLPGFRNKPDGKLSKDSMDEHDFVLCQCAYILCWRVACHILTCGCLCSLEILAKKVIL